ncbi:hypothetical protein QYE76_023413 [Lolium multiflorum]|uniref:TF-B3 domain-containing protein n=1 Tax=Lolium multiflorum TaxID=4521 RepID=A0AAD8RBN4_LOLMU|nr:hypothetical protein QYE76_023413 [Lolium multiflorum]
MDRNSRHSMVMPESFLNYFAWKLSRTIKLEAHDGNVYNVRITDLRNKTVLRSGWEAFVDANNIAEKDLLMFQYRGSARFKVLFFDSSGREKMVFCARIQSNSGEQEPSTYSRDVEDQMDARVEALAKRAKNDALSSPSRNLSGEDSPHERDSDEPDDHALLKPLYVIPKDYALAHFPHKNQTITFQLPGQRKKWHCEFRVRPDGGHCSRCWWDFACDNHLLYGDLCLFQPMKKAVGEKIQSDGSSDSEWSGFSTVGTPKVSVHDEDSSSPMVQHPPHHKFKWPDKTARNIMNILNKEATDKVRTERKIPDVQHGCIVQMRVLITKRIIAMVNFVASYWKNDTIDFQKILKERWPGHEYYHQRQPDQHDQQY